MEITGAAEVRAVLADPSYLVPPVPDSGAPGGIEWLRGSVSRFSNGDVHLRRRGLVCAELERLDIAVLRDATRASAGLLLRDAAGEASEAIALAARVVPVDVLARELGIATPVAPAVAIVARSYHPHTPGGDEADRAVAALVAAFGGVCDEATAAQIALLVQACDATAGLIENALAALGSRRTASVDDLLVATLRSHPPVRATRRQANGAIVTLHLTAGHDAYLPFGSGPRRCPGREHALALAAGVLEAYLAT